MNSKLCYNYPEIGDIIMELKQNVKGIGIMAICADGIIALTDSTHSYDYDLKNAKKIFSHKEFILINAGDTDLISIGNIHVNISDSIQNSINSSNSLNDFLKHISQNLEVDKPLYFIIGCKDISGKYDIGYYRVNKSGYAKEFADKVISYRHYLLQGIDNLNIQTAIACNDVSEILTKYIEIIIELNEKINNTASIGGDIQVGIFR